MIAGGFIDHGRRDSDVPCRNRQQKEEVEAASSTSQSTNVTSQVLASVKARLAATIIFPVPLAACNREAMVRLCLVSPEDP